MSPQHPTKAMEEAHKRILRERAHRAITRKNVEFILEHQNDRLFALTMYLKQCQHELGHPPARTEIIGGDYIEMRFGAWEKALLSIGVRNGAQIDRATPWPEKTKLFQDELALQTELDRREKLERKRANKERAARKKQEQNAAKPDQK